MRSDPPPPRPPEKNPQTCLTLRSMAARLVLTLTLASPLAQNLVSSGAECTQHKSGRTSAVLVSALSLVARARHRHALCWLEIPIRTCTCTCTKVNASRRHAHGSRVRTGRRSRNCPKSSRRVCGCSRRRNGCDFCCTSLSRTFTTTQRAMVLPWS